MGQEIYTKNAANAIVTLMVRDSLTGQGKTALTYLTVTVSYCRPGGTSTPIVLLSGSPGDAYSSGKFAEIDNTLMRGKYQLHLPNACLASGANDCSLSLQATGVIDTDYTVILNDADLRNATNLGLSLMPANTIEIGGTNVSGVQPIVTGTDNKMLVSTDAQDLSTTFHVDAKKLNGATPNNLAAGTKMDIVDVPNPTAITAFKTAFADLSVSVHQILGTTLTESSAGYLAVAFKKFYDIATPTLTTAGIDQTGDTFSKFMSLFFSHFGTAQGGGTNFVQLDTGAVASDDAYRNYRVAILSGPGAGEQGYILYYMGGTRTAVIDHSWVTPPTNASVCVIVGYAKDQLISSSGLAQAGAASSITLSSFDGAAADTKKGEVIALKFGTGVGQKRVILSNNFASKIAVVDRPWDIIPDSTTVYVTYNLDQYLTNGLFDSGIDLTTAQKADLATSTVLAVTNDVGITQVAADKVWNSTATLNPTLKTGLAAAIWDELLSVSRTALSFGAKLKNLVLGTDSKVLISTDVQDLSTTLTVKIPDSSVLTQQNVSDALKLAPTPSTPAVGSVYRRLTDLAGSDGKAVITFDDQDLSARLHVDAKTFAGTAQTATDLGAGANIIINAVGTDGKFPISTDVQDLSTTLTVKTLPPDFVGTDGYVLISTDDQDLSNYLHVDAKKFASTDQTAGDILNTIDAMIGGDGGVVISTDNQDLSTTLHVDAKVLNGVTPVNLDQQGVADALKLAPTDDVFAAGSVMQGITDLESKTNNKIVWEHIGSVYTGKVFLRTADDLADYAFSFARDPLTLALLTDPDHKGPVNFDPWTLI